MPRSPEPRRSRKAEARLAVIRQRRGVTQRELAEKTGVPLTLIYKIETGQNDNPPLRHLVNLALALHVKLEDICEPRWLEWTTLKSNASRAPDPDEFLGPWHRGDVTNDRRYE